jgi:hypothetical protein
MNKRDHIPTSEEWRKLKAEWSHDYGLRRMEDRGVKYEDQAERKLDRDAAGGNGGERDVPLARGIAPGQAAETTLGPAGQPPHPWPSVIAEQNRHQPSKDHGKSGDNEKANGHEAGHSL